MQILIGISIGWITMGVGFGFYLKWHNKKLFFEDRITKGFNDDIRNFKL